MGEVRVLPLGASPYHGNLILCLNCFNHELAYRRSRNRDLAKDCAFRRPAWETLEVYGAEVAK